MNSQEIRQSFIDFFADRGHLHLPSAPLVPHGDPTLLFVNAGMVQFKDWFLGREKPRGPRAVTVQKCLRVSGKHNDLENVGPSPRHHTFFEMLGNFSFGDYFKEDAIRFGWELVTEGWGLKKEHLYATVYEEDDDAYDLWLKIAGLPESRVLRCGKADNFWAMGDTGPCGPCSEIFVDFHPDRPHVPWEEGTDSGRYLEIWNLVFMQFERDADGNMTPLPNPSIDTGAGLERVAAALERVESNYDTDLFQPILSAAADLSGTAYGRDAEPDVSLRVIGDHLRAVAFLLADGVIPAPDGRGYVLRRLLRRAVRHGMRIGLEEPFLHRLVPVLDDIMGAHYAELEKVREASIATIREEEEKYLSTRALGARRVQEAIDRVHADGRSELAGDEVFRLYDTYGLELETVREIAEEEQITLDEAGFEQVLEERRKRSRATTGELQKRLQSLHAALSSGEGEETETVFEGYDLGDASESRVLQVAAMNGDGAEAVDGLDAGRRGVVVLDRTSFYAESGGQVGDQGRLLWDGGRARVTDTQKDTSGIFFHFVTVEEGRLEPGQAVRPEVDAERRVHTERNHTGTHVLHAALRQVLGEGVRQAGSLVAPNRLRFDFTYSKPVTPEELRRIEEIANHWVLRAVPTDICWRGHKEAVEAGAMALFGEKYGERVRTVEIPGFSLELCGGCHVRNSGEIGPLFITAERGIASGVRRIEAVTGLGALELVRRRQELLEGIEAQLSVPAERAAGEAGSLKNKLKELERELAETRRKLVAGDTAAQEEIEVGGIRLVAREVPQAPTAELRNLADTLRDKLGSGVVVLAARDDEKVSVIATVSKDLTSRLSAGTLVKSLAEVVGGRGGGRPDFAQAGGREPDKLPQLLAAVPEIVGDQLGPA
ncbi:MAG: alanine--tRNA ligase [bacterium]|nr:alanine--tRNA ligase [bacterium]